MEQKNNSPAVVQIQGLYKKYSKKADYAIENVTFSCHEGEIVGLLGHNGAGKSTTLKCLEGMLPFEKGSISISGYDIKKEPVKAKMNMGFVTDNHAVFVKMTGIQYVSFMADIYKVSTKLRKERLDALELHLAARLRERGHHDPLCRVALVGSGLDLFSGPDLDRRLRMRDAHRRADEEGHIESLGKLERVARESERLGGVEHGNMRRAGVVVRILLVLRRVHARIVGSQHDKSSANAGICSREQRVRRDVHTDVLHGRKNAGATGRCADAHLNGNLLVHAPLGIDAILLRKRLECLSRRGTRVRDANTGAGFPSPLSNRLISA